MSDDPKPTLKLKTATPTTPKADIPPITSKTELGVAPPFPSGTRLRYVGTQRLFAGYQMISILEPGQEIDVIDTVGEYSVYETVAIGERYRFLITNAERAQWVPVGVA